MQGIGFPAERAEPEDHVHKVAAALGAPGVVWRAEGTRGWIAPEVKGSCCGESRRSPPDGEVGRFPRPTGRVALQAAK